MNFVSVIAYKEVYKKIVDDTPVFKGLCAKVFNKNRIVDIYRLDDNITIVYYLDVTDDSVEQKQKYYINQSIESFLAKLNE